MKINVIDRDGKKHELDADPGDTLEWLVSQKGISSDWGICGGCCACSSCQVYMQEKDYAVIGAPDDTEQAVLDDMAYESKSTSRLGCPLTITEKMEGWTFVIAPY